MLYLRREGAVSRDPADCLVWHPPAVLKDLRVAALRHILRGRAWSRCADRLCCIPVVGNQLWGIPDRHGRRASPDMGALRDPPVEGGGLRGQIRPLR